MSKHLSPAQVDRYCNDGIVFPLSVLAPEEVTRFRSELETLEARMGGKPKAVEMAQLHLHFAWAYELATHETVLDAVEDVLGPDLLVWACGVFTKYPKDPGFVSWHQDGTYWGLDSSEVVTAWIALSDSTTENGCMRVVPGSHVQPLRPHVDTFAENNVLTRGQEIAADVDEAEAVDVVLRAGEMSLHHVNLIHGSNANASDSKRIGFTVRFITPQVRRSGLQQPVVLARGEDRHGNLPLLERPPTAGIEEGFAAHVASARQHLESLLKTKGPGTQGADPADSIRPA